MCKSGFRDKKIIALYNVLQQQDKIINDKYNKPYDGGSYFELRYFQHQIMSSEGRPGVCKGGVYARATQCVSPPVAGDHAVETATAGLEKLPLFCRGMPMPPGTCFETG